VIANYGYRDGSGEYFIIINTDRCDGCGQCGEACPQDVLEIIINDYDDVVAAVTEAHRNKIKYSCGPCKTTSGAKNLPCISACKPGAISHSW